jgi:C-terminal processing protease CtpA/Prc
MTPGKYLDSLIIQSKDVIVQANHWIIDVRDNRGGSRKSYEGILGYLYTSPIRIEGGWFLSSPDIIEISKKYRSEYPEGSSSRNFYNYRIEKMEQFPGSLIPDTGFLINYDTVLKKPARVSVLVNKNCGSACELFLISAKQSAKVTVFGESSFGGIDRGDAYIFDCGCNGLRISIPIGKRKPEIYKKPIDNIGIPPDVNIPIDTDWIKFVETYKVR